MKKLVNLAAVAAVVLLMVTTAIVYVSPRVGYRASNVVSGSMEPTLSAGTMVVAHKVAMDVLKVGDIITFRPAGIGELPICHRIVEIVNTTPSGFKTQGDADKTAGKSIDPWIVPQANVTGMVEFHIPMLGYFIQFLKEKIGLMVGLVFPALIIIFFIFKIVWKDLVKYIRSTPAKQG